MAVPVLAVAVVALAGMQIAGSLASGSAARQIGERNAQTDEQNALFARKAGNETGRMTRLASRQATGTLRSGWATTGMDVNSGTAVDVMRSSETQYELDALKAEYSGEVQAQGYERSAALQRFQGRMAQRMGYIGAGSAAASGAARLASSFERGRVDTGQNSPPSVMGGGPGPQFSPQYFEPYQGRTLGDPFARGGR